MLGKIVASIDIGSYKIKGIIGRITEDGYKILGYNDIPSAGVEKGRLVDITELTHRVKEVYHNACDVADINNVDVVCFGVGGSHIELIEKESLPIPVSNGRVTERDVERVREYVLRNVKKDAEYLKKEVIQSEVQYFKIDDSDKEVKNPVDMSGEYLKVNMAVLVGDKNEVKDYCKVATGANIPVPSLFVQPLAASAAVLRTDEKEAGVACIDIGDQTTDIVVYKRQKIRRKVKIINRGGKKVTEDIASRFGITLKNAEEIKKKYGKAMVDLMKEEEKVNKIETFDTQGNPLKIPQIELVQTIENSMRDLLMEIVEVINSELHPIDTLVAGVVITGGVANLHGLRALAYDVMKLSAIRIGYPVTSCRDLNKPEFAVSIGMLKMFSNHNVKRVKAKGGFSRFFDFFRRLGEDIFK